MESWDEEARTRKGERDFVGLERRGEKEKEGEERKRWRGREDEEKERMEGRVAMYVELRVDNHKTQHLSLLFFFFFFFFFPSLSVSLSCSCSHNNNCGCYYYCKLVYALARETHGGYVFQDWPKGSTMDLVSL